MTARIGFACKYISSPEQVSDKACLDDVKHLNTIGTTLTWMKKQSRQVAEDRLWKIIIHNIESIKNLVDIVGAMPKMLRMFRISSDVLPFFTEPSLKYFYEMSDVKSYCEKNFRQVGDLARNLDVRLSFHPGQFVVLASDNPDIVTKSIEEFEYHTTMARWMGYGTAWHDHGFKINVHISGKRGPQGIIDVLGRLSPESRNLITIENDELTWGIDASLALVNHVALVLDIHHHLIHSGGEYIMPWDNRWKKIIESWHGIRPVIHYSTSREDVLLNHDRNTLPDIKTILQENTIKKTKLRAHSDSTWNRASNSWALLYLQEADIMIEAKYKNIASKNLYEQYHE
jgi:UV DNA damage repair endonuclease